MLTPLALAALAAPSGQAVRLAPVRTFDQFRVTALAAAPTGGRIAFATEGREVVMMDASTGQRLRTMTGHPDAVLSLSFNRAGTLLASADATARIYLWDVKTGKKVREFPRTKGHQRGISAIAFSPDGSRLATVGNDDSIRVWRTSGGDPVKAIIGKNDNFYGVAFGPNGALLTGTLKDGLRVYSPGSFNLFATLPVPGGQGVNNIALHPMGLFAVTAGRDGRATLFDVRARQRLTGMQGHGDWVMGAAFSPNGRFVATTSNDANLILWSVASRSQVAKLDGRSYVGSPVAFTGDGRFLVTTTSADAVQIFSVTPPQGAAAPPTGRRRR